MLKGYLALTSSLMLGERLSPSWHARGLCGCNNRVESKGREGRRDCGETREELVKARLFVWNCTVLIVVVSPNSQASSCYQRPSSNCLPRSCLRQNIYQSLPSGQIRSKQMGLMANKEFELQHRTSLASRSVQQTSRKPSCDGANRIPLKLCRELSVADRSSSA